MWENMILSRSMERNWFHSGNPVIQRLLGIPKWQVLAKKAGKATITATLGGKKFNCTVTVKNTPVSNKWTKNYTKLKKYIQQNGEINDDGNYEVEQDFSNSVVLVAYNKKR